MYTYYSLYRIIYHQYRILNLKNCFFNVIFIKTNDKARLMNTIKCRKNRLAIIVANL